MSEESKSAGQILVDELKEQGIEVAEEAAKGIVNAVFNAADKYIDATETKIDDMAKPILGLAKNFILDKVDKINPND